MRYMAGICSAIVLALSVVGCGGSETKTIRHETVQTVPAAPIVTEHRSTTIERD